jgi:hypothetical protein
LTVENVSNVSISIKLPSTLISTDVFLNFFFLRTRIQSRTDRCTSGVGAVDVRHPIVFETVICERSDGAQEVRQRVALISNGGRKVGISARKDEKGQGKGDKGGNYLEKGEWQ